jgi:hypothetical protein
VDAGWPFVGVIVVIVGVVGVVAAVVAFAAERRRRTKPLSAADEALAGILPDSTRPARSGRRPPARSPTAARRRT